MTRPGSIHLGTLLAAFFSLLGCELPAEAPVPDMTLPLEERLDALLPGLLAEHGVPGAAVVMIEGGETLVRGYGLRRAGRPEPIGPDTVFEAASLGKPLFAYAMMQRVEAGALDLDRPLAEDLERLPTEDEARFRRITARQVLAHTTGLPNWRPNRFSDDPGPLRVLRKPGEAFGYSGEGYMALQQVSERQAGESMERSIQTSLFEPLGMSRSRYSWTRSFETDFALPHDREGKTGEKRYLRRAGAAYSLHSTAADLARFLQRMLDRTDAIAEAMLAPQVEISGRLAWSLGWGLERRPECDWFWQWGDNSGFKHFALGSRRQGRAVLVLTNGDKGPHVYRTVVEAALGVRPEALSFKMIRY